MLARVWLAELVWAEQAHPCWKKDSRVPALGSSVAMSCELKTRERKTVRVNPEKQMGGEKV